MTSRITALDGLRGLACLSVLVAHYFGEIPHGCQLLALGWAGVDLFFCLSGFLIGGILLDNRHTSSFFLTFYIRRGLRIFPIYYLTISITLLAIWELYHRVVWVDPALPAVSYYTYSQNFLLPIVNDHATLWLLPTWTLCVEEQFYLLLPLIIYVVPRQKLFLVIILLILSASLFRLTMSILGANELALLVLLPSRWDLLCLGVFGAYLYRDRQLWVKLIARHNRILKISSLTSAAAVLPCVLLDKYFGTMLFQVFGSLMVGICCVSFLLLIVSGSPEGARLRSRQLRYFGSISYGLYLLHQPIAGILHGLVLGGRPDIATPEQILVTCGALVVSVIVASVSWRFFEYPLIELGRRWRYDGAAHQ